MVDSGAVGEQNSVVEVSLSSECHICFIGPKLYSGLLVWRLLLKSGLFFIQYSGVWAKPESGNFSQCIDSARRRKSMSLANI